jgi:alkyl hydroperoxide reductase subunit F
MHKHDLIIIGGGPCGLTSAIYSVRNKLDVIVLTKDIGGQMAWSGTVENYTGYKSISGPDLTDKFEEHAKELGTSIKMESVLSIQKEEDTFIVKTNRSEYRSIAVLIAAYLG